MPILLPLLENRRDGDEIVLKLDDEILITNVLGIRANNVYQLGGMLHDQVLMTVKVEQTETVFRSHGDSPLLCTLSQESFFQAINPKAEYRIQNGQGMTIKIPCINTDHQEVIAKLSIRVFGSRDVRIRLKL